MLRKLTTYLGIALFKGVAGIPFPVLYFISDILRLLVYNVFRYRRRTVRNNLKHSFPDLDSRKISKIERKYYNYLCDLILESLKTYRLSGKQLEKRMVILNPELLNTFAEKQKSILVMAMHYGNWEWLLHMPKLLKHHVLFVYKPIQNQYLDNYLNTIRERFGGETISMSLTLRKLIEAEKRGNPVLTWLASDQTPPWFHPFWTIFLHQEAMFFNGPAKLAQRFDQPVLFQQIRRIKRGYYETWFEILVENPRSVTEEFITMAYVRKVESVIKEDPAWYLWSHRRWKHKRAPDIPLYSETS